MNKLKLAKLAKHLEGDFYYNSTMRKLYATDASMYKELPLAVAVPKTKKDITKLICFANEDRSGINPPSFNLLSFKYFISSESSFGL